LNGDRLNDLVFDCSRLNPPAECRETGLWHQGEFLCWPDPDSVAHRTDGLGLYLHDRILPLDSIVDQGKRASPPVPRSQAMNKNQVKGRVNEIKGKIKETAGKLTGDKTTEYKGKVEKHAGKIEAGYGDVRNDHE
jgi:uncharacterized protein YjbJ (UPF0337 family)